MWVKHRLQGHLSGFQLFILVVNSSRIPEFRISSGRIFHTFPAKHFSDFKPYINLLKVETLGMNAFKKTFYWYELDISSYFHVSAYYGFRLISIFSRFAFEENGRKTYCNWFPISSDCLQVNYVFHCCRAKLFKARNFYI